MNTLVAIISKAILGLPIRTLLIKEIKGWENIPEGNFILASNHLSHADWFMCGYICAPRKFVFIGQTDKYTGFTTAGISRSLIYWWASTIPINRVDKQSKKQAITTAVKMLKDGYRVIIYPEGTRSRDGQMHEFKRGLGKLYLESGVKILPVAMKGTNEILPPHGKFKMKKAARINIGKPLEFEQELAKVKGMDQFSDEYNQICTDVSKKVEDKVRELLNQS